MNCPSFGRCKALPVTFIFLLAILVLPLSALAALQVSFIQENPSLSIGEEGTWEVKITNPDSDDVTTSLTVTLPSDFTITDAGGGTENAGPPQTLEWTGISISGNDGSATRTYRARPNCDVVDGQEMEAGAGSATAFSTAITIEIPVVGVSLLDDLGNTVTDANVGDIITWELTVDNSGEGTLAAGADITFTLGAAFSFDSITSPSHTVPPTLAQGSATTWNSGEILADGMAEYQITATVTGCDRTALNNDVSVTWTDGTTECPASPFTASASVSLEILEPAIAITVTNPGPLGYCPSEVTTAEVIIENSGDGPAQNFTLQMNGWPATWQVTPQTAGVTFDPAMGTFSLPDVEAGDTLTFQFDIQPGGACPPADTATLLFLPQYDNQCGETFGTRYFTPVVGPRTWTMGAPESPTFTVDKSGPTEVEVGEEGLFYTVQVTYTGPEDVLPLTVDVTDDYSDMVGFTITGITGGGNDDGSGTITWSNVDFTSNGSFVEYQITMDAPTDPCAGFNTYCNQATVSAVPDDCRGCPGVINQGEACTYVQDTNGDIVADSSVVVVSDNPADVCTDNIQFTTCYTFDSGAPTDWDGMELDNTMDAAFTLVSIDSVTVNGTDYAGFLGISSFPMDLTDLTNSAAPAPNTGALNSASPTPIRLKMYRRGLHQHVQSHRGRRQPVRHHPHL